MDFAAPPVSIIIPVYNEVPVLPQEGLSHRVLRLLALLRQEDEILLVDGGSQDSSWSVLQQLAQQPRISAIQSGKGRALQMNTGAALARGQVLLFLHADTQLDKTALQELFSRADAMSWGRFNVEIEGRSKCLPMVAWFMNRRSSLSKICTGDQAIFVGREWFRQVGGFPLQPLMEDIEFCKRLKTLAPKHFFGLRSTVRTSGRRWDQNGAWKTILLMWRFRYQYWRGVSADTLASQYADTREKLPYTVAVFAKYPEPGQVKTRLAPLLGHEHCALFARYLLLKTLGKLESSHVVLWTSGGTEEQWASLLDGRGVHRCIQPEGHLGIRMQAAVEAHLKTSKVVVLLGPDAVQFGKHDLDALVNAALEKSIAFVPALDGGYVALACTQSIPSIFSGSIHWGTSTVAEQTRQALQIQGIKAVWLNSQMDIDESEDYQAAIQLGYLPANWQAELS